ncbi:hypothetical protein PFZ55_41415 [Streptomyces sp. MS2A]|uniref:NshR/TsnR family 23S rRNA methyltransferase n=1 Tax=Microbacterium resistens TaxID=156977 RepID=A0ABY3RUJ0_9MICO|nr:TrmH family RNA methyltransferase [Microbacterium resistens]MDA4893341.1 hypothetical protein [Streptomyces sp. MS2A]UGS27733.1 NshR/TsnR family 23S rRNA methyltransferase [Microbacterium resistens]
MTSALLPLSHAEDRTDETVVRDPRHPAIRRVADVLRSRSPRPRTIVVDDEENVAQAIRAGVRIATVYAAESHEEAGRRVHAQAPSAAFVVVADRVLRALFGSDKLVPVFALAVAPASPTWAGLSRRPGDVLVLDGVRIPGNIGAIVRTACAFDVAGVVLVDSGLSSVHDRRLIRASRGLVFSLPVLRTTAAGLEGFLAAERIPLVSLAADAGAPLSGVAAIPGRIAILMGAERRGASRRLDGLARWRYAVPMTAGVESLNVSVAAGIALYERSRG